MMELLLYIALLLFVATLVYVKVLSGYAAKPLDVKGKHMVITGEPISFLLEKNSSV